MIKLNGHEIKPTMFPDGTSQVWKIPDEVFEPVSSVVWEFENEAEVFHLVQLNDLLVNDKRVHSQFLHIPFMPYGRQDKSPSNGSTFALFSLYRILTELNFTTITTLDIHSLRPFDCYLSDIMPNLVNVEPVKDIKKVIEKTECNLVCFPDIGALNRYNGIQGDLPSCSFTKVRHPKTGYIEQLYLNELQDVKGESVLIIDDIADGGMTFILTAKKLLDLGAKEVHLYTTHGIYSKGVNVLFDSGISRIFNRKGEVFRDGE